MSSLAKVWLGLIALCIAIWAGLIWVAVHFINKFW